MGLFSRCRETVISSCCIVSLLALSTAATAAGPSADRDAQALKARVNLAMNLTDSSLVSLELAQAVPGEALTLTVPIDGVDVTLDLRPHSVRADGYRLIVQDANGYADVEPGIERTLRGSILEVPGSEVAASLQDGGLAVAIRMPAGDRFFIEPAPDAPNQSMHVVYHEDDVIDTGSTCGTDEAFEVLGDDPLPLGGGGVAGGGGDLYETELACDTDVEYFVKYGTVEATEARINEVINTVNLQYESQACIRHRITAIIVRTEEPDPYTAMNADGLLDEMLVEWESNLDDIPRDTAHLFTDRSLPLPGTIGLAYVGVICHQSLAYGLSYSDFNDNFACATDLTAHELGHNWSSGHCACPGFTMNPSITCANFFSDASLDAIINHRDTRFCVDVLPLCGVAPPANDDCANAIAVVSGQTPFTTLGATTDGNPATTCTFFGYNQIDNDIWFTYTTECTGNLTISLCGSDYDTKMAVYVGDCTAAEEPPVICNDDSCAFQSRIIGTTTVGTEVLIRIGGFQGSTGAGMLTISCLSPETVTGACCMPGDTCTDAQTETECADAGGVYKGDGVTCAGLADCTIITTCGEAGAGDCFEGGTTPFCDNACCCDIVCAADPFCCSTVWDVICGNTAAELCVFADECVDATPITDADVIHFTNEMATTGSDPNIVCPSGGDTGVGNDIWFSYVASCAGSVTVSLCLEDEDMNVLTNFDSKLAIYEGACPAMGGTPIACDDNACGNVSEAVFTPTLGETYYIRLGGGFGATGCGFLTASCGPPVATACQGDANKDGTVNVTDLNMVVLDWGSSGTVHGGDLTGALPGSEPDGMVDVNDVAAVILNWGACP